MDLTKINAKTISDGYFSLSDLLAKIEAVSSSGVALVIGRLTNKPHNAPPDSDWFLKSCDATSFFEALGWIDLQYPCEGPRKLFIRANLPSEYKDSIQMSSIISDIIDLFSIPTDTVYIAYHFTAGETSCVTRRDEFGRG